MILLASTLIPIMLLAAYVYFSTAPEHLEKRQKRAFNSVVLGAGAACCIGTSLYFYFTTGKSVDSAWWPVAAFFGSAIVFTLVLFIGGLYRNFMLFKK